MRKVLERLKRQLAGSRRDSVRVGLQTAVAAVATYWVMTASGWEQHVSWAVISALFTISVSADAAVLAAAGRILGAFLGVALGLTAGMLLPVPVAVGLALATAAANMIAAVWPGLSFMAVTAAIVALDPSPDPTEALERAAAVLAGTMIGAVATFVAWPSFGRQRAARALERVLGDCETLLGVVIMDREKGDRDRNDVYGRFLTDLESVRSYIGQTLFAPRLPDGVPLREVAVAVESLWHALVILDRVVLDERATLGPELVARIAEPIGAVQAAAKAVIGELARGIGCRNGCQTSTERLAAACDAARDDVAVLRRTTEPGGDDRVAKRLHALVFAFDETERRLVQLSDMLAGGAAQGELPLRGRAGPVSSGPLSKA